MSQKPKSAHLAEAEKGCICNPMGWSRDSRCPVHGDSAPKPPGGPTAPCPDADVCQRCPAAADDDVCFPCERLAAELLDVRLKAVRDLQEADLEIYRLRAALRNVRLAAEEVQSGGRYGGRLDELLAITTKLGEKS